VKIEYAKEAVKQGSTSLGLKSDNYVVSYLIDSDGLNQLSRCWYH